MIQFSFLIFISFYLPIGTTASLNPKGLNVCERRVTENRPYYVQVNYQTVVSYKTCCGWSWPTCWSSCYKTRLVTQTSLVLRTKQVEVSVFSCCDGYSQNGDQCPTPTCSKGCFQGNCVAPERCECDQGWSGESCNEDKNECLLENGGCEQLCKNFDGGYECVCISGYTRSKDDSKKCLDNNECEIDGICSCADSTNNPLCSSTCNNTPGAFQCLCAKGYANLKDDKQICININECQLSNGNCSHFCYDTPGSFQCSCPIGYRLGSDQKTCLDIDECSTANGGCGDTCNNTIGSFVCSCRSGYILDFNGLTCSDQNECETRDHGCEFCENKEGTYICGCPKGFKLNADGKTCSDVDECSTDLKVSSGKLSGCSQHCNNTIGSFYCYCSQGYELTNDNKTCQDVNECDRNISKCDHVCVNTIGSYICRCNKGYVLENDYVSCIGVPCEDLAALRNGYTTCLSGRTGDSCSMNCNNGFFLEGSKKRWCQINQKWNGTTAVCKRKVCPTWDQPLFSVENLPCINLYESKCQVKCIAGYTVNGSIERTCSISNDGNMEWVNSTLACEKSTACYPNPCLHGGECGIKDSDHENNYGFTCDCTNTGFKGKRCEIGILQIPQIPLLYKNDESGPLEFRAFPDVELYVSISSNSVNLTVTPSVLRYSKAETSLFIRLVAKTMGFYLLSFNLSGNSSNEFMKPDNQVVYVVSHGVKGNASPILSDGSLAKGCYTGNVPEVSSLSNYKWNEDGSSNGIVQIQDSNGALIPLSFSGGRFTATVFEAFQLPVVALENNKDNCLQSSPSVYLSQLININLFMYSVQQVFNKNSPYWFKLIAPLTISGFVSQDFIGSIFKGKELIEKTSLCSIGLELDTDHIYYMYETKQTFYVYLPNSNVTLPNVVSKCILQDLSSRRVFISLFPTSATGVTQLSDQFTKFINFNGTVDRIGFEINSNQSDKVFSHGKSRIFLSNNGVVLDFCFDGMFSWMVNDLNNMINNKEVTFESKQGTLDLILIWGSSSNGLQIKGGLSHLKSYSQNISAFCTITTVKASTISSKIALNKVIDNIVSFNNSKEVHTTFRYENQNTVSVQKKVIKFLKVKLNETADLENMLIYLNKLPTEFLDVNESKTIMIETINDLLMESKNLSANISALSVNDQIEKIGALRYGFLIAQKRFQILKDRYLDHDLLDVIAIRERFETFLATTLAKVSMLNFEIEKTSVKRLTEIQFSLYGKFCILSNCFKNSDIMIIYSTASNSTNCSQAKNVHSNQTIIKATLLAQESFGGMVKLPKGTEITTVVENSKAITTFDGKIDFRENTYTVNAVIEDNQMYIKPINITVFASDSIQVHMNSSLENVGANEAILFKINGHFVYQSNFLKSINFNIQKFVRDKENRIAIRQTLSHANKVKSERDAKDALLQYLSSTNKLSTLEVQLSNIINNISDAESNVAKQKEAFLVEANSYEANVIIKEMSKKITNDCVPKLCDVSCIPGLITKSCQSDEFVHRLERNCKVVLKQSTKFVFIMKNETLSYTSFDHRKECHTKCPPLTKFFKSIFGKRKRRGIVKEIAVQVLEKAFQELGGDEGALGSSIGGMLLGPAGAVIGGMIGSIFGSCQNICNVYSYPVTKFQNISKLEEHEVLLSIPEAQCESSMTEIKVGYSESKTCLNYTECANLVGDKNCVEKHQLCAQLRNNISIMIENPNYVKAHDSYAKVSLYYSLLRREYDTIESKIKSVREESEILKGISLIANQTKRISLATDIELMKQIQMDQAVIESLKTYKPDETIQNITFTYDMYGGMNFPRRILIDVVFNNNVSSANTSTLFIDLDNYDRSIDDTTEAIYRTIIDSINSKPRKRRSLEPENNIKLRFEEKCVQMEQSSLFLIEFVNSVLQKIHDFENQLTTYYQYKKKGENDVLLYINAMKHQTDQVLNRKDSGIEKIISGIENVTRSLIMENSSVPSWTKALSNFFVFYEIKVATDRNGNCYNFKDCIEQNLNDIKGLLRNENNKIALTVLESISSWNETIMSIVDDLPDINKTKKLITSLNVSLTQTNPNELFCGKLPILEADLPRVKNTVENAPITLSVTLHDTIFETEIVWKKGNIIIPNERSNQLTIDGSLTSAGYYTCELRNKFGVTFCNTTLVQVYQIPVFIETPVDMNILEKSVNISYLKCITLANHPVTIAWYFTKFTSTEKILLLNTKDVFNFEPNKFYESGYYWCEVSNPLHRVESRKAMVNVLSTSVAVERMKLTFAAHISIMSNRKRRSELNTGDSLQTNISSSELKDLQLKIAKATNVEEDRIQNITYLKLTENKTEISFILYGEDLTKAFLDLPSTSNWEELSNTMVKSREDLVLRSILLYYEANRTSISLSVGAYQLQIDPATITTEGMDVKCPFGQVVVDNGFICGDCPAGTVYDSITQECTRCRKDTFNPFPKQTVCIDCPPATYTDNTMAVSQFQCKTLPTIVALQSTVETTTNDKSTAVPILEKAKDDNKIRIIIAVIVVIIILIIIVIIVVCAWKRKCKSEKDTDIDTGHANPTFDVENDDGSVQENPYTTIGGGASALTLSENSNYAKPRDFKKPEVTENPYVFGHEKKEPLTFRNLAYQESPKIREKMLTSNSLEYDSLHSIKIKKQRSKSHYEESFTPFKIQNINTSENNSQYDHIVKPELEI